MTAFQKMPEQIVTALSEPTHVSTNRERSESSPTASFRS
jgi:hypothetical protein